jgi:type II secretory pathway pseudopilin PulG
MYAYLKKQFSSDSPASFKKGFTIVEALVAIFILVISVTALMGVVSQSIFTSGYIKNKAVAISLAQEGIELVRNIQDSILLSSDYGNSPFQVVLGDINGLYPCIFLEGVCTIDAVSLEIDSCPNGVCPPLRVSDTGYFNYTFGDESNFTRSIEVVPTGQDSGRVTSRVEWLQGSTLREVVYEEDLFLWIQ